MEKETLKNYVKREEYIYMNFSFRMSNKRMADILYAGILTDSKFTTLWTMSGKAYDRKQNAWNEAAIVIHIHPSRIQIFEEMTGCKLKKPLQVQTN